ncbi:MAG: ATP-dependent sacrificial sulfur transferase LarE [Nitrospirota bacterium]
MDGLLDRLDRILRDLDSVLVAFSGGVDSSLLLHVASRVLGPQAKAVTFVSPLIPQEERLRAADFCHGAGVKQIVVDVDALAIPEIRENPPDRCYHCKRHLFLLGLSKARELGIAHLVEGSQLSDAADHRPGRRALAELGIRSPLAEAGLDKEQVRRLSRELGLSTWNLPPMACLASRIPFGTPLTRERLARVDAAEEFLRHHGFILVRVRDIGGNASIELSPDDVPRLADGGFRLRLVAHFKELGFTSVRLDPEGYRTGKLNELIANREAEI